MGEKLDIALVVSVGSGIFPVENLGKTDAQKFLYFGKHWLKAGSSIKATAKSLISLLTTAVSGACQPRERACNSTWQNVGGAPAQKPLVVVVLL